VPHRRQQAPDQLSLHDLDDRQAVHREESGEGVAGGLEGGEAEPDGRAEDHPVAQRPGAQVTSQYHQRAEFHRFLDQPDAEEQPRRRVQQVRLEHRGAQHTQDAAGEERR
jgi:hypothetical protein